MPKQPKFTPISKHLILLSAVLVINMAGCTLGPNYLKPDVATPGDWAEWHSGSQELLDPKLRQAGTSKHVPWWQTFDDATLNKLVEMAQDANPDLQIAALHFAQSRTQRNAVAAEQGPRFDGRAGATRTKQSENGTSSRTIDTIAPTNRDSLVQALSEPFSVYEAGFDASWELDLWGRVRRSIEAADSRIQSAATTLVQVQLTLQTEVVRRYFELRAAQQQIRIARAQVATAKESLDIARAKARDGLIDDLAVVQQETLLAEQRAQLPQLMAEEALASSRISLLLGKRPGTMQTELADQGTVLNLATLPDLHLGIPSELARHRPDIRHAEAELHAATASIGIAVADLYPRLTLGAGLGLESTSASKFGDWGSAQWSIGPSLYIPIFDQGRRRAVVQLRELQQQEAAVAYQQTVLKAWHEVDDSLSAYSAEHQRHIQIAEKSRSSSEALTLSETRYRNGIASYLAVIDARHILLQSEREEAGSALRLFLDFVAIRKATGGSLSPDFDAPFQQSDATR